MTEFIKLDECREKTLFVRRELVSNCLRSERVQVRRNSVNFELEHWVYPGFRLFCSNNTMIMRTAQKYQTTEFCEKDNVKKFYVVTFGTTTN
jgi:hypothetical protein